MCFFYILPLFHIGLHGVGVSLLIGTTVAIWILGIKNFMAYMDQDKGQEQDIYNYPGRMVYRTKRGK